VTKPREIATRHRLNDLHAIKSKDALTQKNQICVIYVRGIDSTMITFTGIFNNACKISKFLHLYSIRVFYNIYHIFFNCFWKISVLRLGARPGNLSQNGQKPTPLVTSLIKSPKPQIFFHCRLKDLLHLFEGLNISLAQLNGQLRSCKVAQNSNSCGISRYINLYTISKRVKQKLWLQLVFTSKTHMNHFVTVTLQHHNSPADCSRELFKCSKDVASLLVYIR